MGGTNGSFESSTIGSDSRLFISKIKNCRVNCGDCLDDSLETAQLQLDDVDSSNIKNLILGLASKKT